MPAPDPFPLPDPVRLTGEELGGADVPTDALRAAALAYAREHLQGTVAFNGPPAGRSRSGGAAPTRRSMT
jgi:hypothetical protein